MTKAAVRFSHTYNHRTDTGHEEYPAGFEGEVPREAALAAVAAGAAKSITPQEPAPPAGGKTKA